MNNGVHGGKSENFLFGRWCHLVLFSAICSPHHFCAEGGEEAVAEWSDNLDGVWCFADGEANSVGIALAASVEGDEKGTAAAFDLEGDFSGVGENNGAHIERVGGDGSEADGFALRDNDGAANGEGVGGGACGSGNEQSVGLIGGEIFAVDGGVDGNHRGNVMLEDGNFVECVGSVAELYVGGSEGKHRVALDCIAVSEDVVDGLSDVVGRVG